MALSVEKLLTDAHMLITRLKGHDSLADGIIGNSQALFNKVEAMKQYQDDITELNEIAKHRPRSTLVLGIAQENRQIRQLQQENRELEASLEEHQSALELIMQKYREHTVKLLQSNQIERALKEKESAEKNSMCHLMDKIDEMAGVMQKAIEVDETSGCVDKERLRRMEVENKALREMLEICTTSRDKIVALEAEAATTPTKMADGSEEDKTEEEGGDEGSDSEADTATLKRFKDKDGDDNDSDDVDSSTLKRNDNTSSSSSSSSSVTLSSSSTTTTTSSSLSSAKEKEKEEPTTTTTTAKKEEKKETSTTAGGDSKKKTDAKKPDTLGAKDGASGGGGKDSAATRSGSKSPVANKSTGDVKKSRISSSPVKKTTSANKRESPSSSASLKKTSTQDLKKDQKKAPAKTGAKK